MKVTRSRLKEIIKEELRLLKESNIISEDGHTDVPSARRKMKTSVEDAMQILQGLEAMPDEGELPSWWMGKVTLAADYLNKARDYFLVSEAKEDGFRPDPEEVTRLLAKKFPDLADGRVTQKIGKNDLMVFIAEEYDISEQTAMQVVEELIQEGFIGMFTDFVNIINADFDEDYDDYEDDAYAMASAGFGTDEDYGFYGESIEKMAREELSRFLNENSEAKAAAEAVINDAKRKDINLKQLATQDREKFAETVSELLSTMVIDDVDDTSVEKEILNMLKPMSEGLETLMSHMNPEDLGLIIKVLGKVAYNFSPAVFGTIAYSAARRIAGLDSEFEKRQEIERLAAEYKGKQS